MKFFLCITVARKDLCLEESEAKQGSPSRSTQNKLSPRDRGGPGDDRFAHSLLQTEFFFFNPHNIKYEVLNKEKLTLRLD